MTHDPVNNPAHYRAGGLEAIDVIEAFGLGFRLGNVVKYVLRAWHKGRALEDLKKARWYLDREIGALEKKIAAAGGQQDEGKGGDAVPAATGAGQNSSAADYDFSVAVRREMGIRDGSIAPDPARAWELGWQRQGPRRNNELDTVTGGLLAWNCKRRGASDRGAQKP